MKSFYLKQDCLENLPNFNIWRIGDGSFSATFNNSFNIWRKKNPIRQISGLAAGARRCGRQSAGHTGTGPRRCRR